MKINSRVFREAQKKAYQNSKKIIVAYYIQNDNEITSSIYYKYP